MQAEGGGFGWRFRQEEGSNGGAAFDWREGEVRGRCDGKKGGRRIGDGVSADRFPFFFSFLFQKLMGKE